MNRRDFLEACVAAGVVWNSPRVVAFVEGREEFTDDDVRRMVNIYVDPAIAADAGDGTIGDPYGDLSFAIEQTRFNPLKGLRINIKASEPGEIIVDGEKRSIEDYGD